MRKNRNSTSGVAAAGRWLLIMSAGIALFLALAPRSRAQTADAKPATLSKQRVALYLKASQAPLANLESDVNHLALLSEACRVEYGTQACGLPDKPLESSKLEERYAYYVKQPVEAHSKEQGAKITRQDWEGRSTPPAR